MIQVARGSEFRKNVNDQYAQIFGEGFDRGTIYFTSKSGEFISAATLKNGYKFAIDPSNIENPELIYNDIGQALGVDRDFFMKRALKEIDPYEEIETKVDPATYETLKEYRHKGVIFERQDWRFYPANSLAAQTIGFTAFEGDIINGRYGLERSFDKTLERTSSELYVNFFAEVFANVSQSFTQEERQHQGDIVTTLEPSVQLFLHQKLISILEQWSAENAGGIIMDPSTGEILALETVPTFNLNEYSQVDDIAVYRNPIVEDLYEMGSVFKPIVMAVGLETGAVEADTPFYDAGFVDLGNDIVIRNFDRIGRGMVTMQDVLNQSLNTGMVYVGQEVGNTTMKRYLDRFEFDKRTGIELPNEARGLITNLETLRDIEYANISFGQGIAVTPLHLARAIGSLANSGYAVTPTIIKEIQYVGGSTEKPVRPEAVKVFEKETTDEITRMLVNLVDTSRNGELKMERYSIAAKTGTAQIPNPQGGYYQDRNLHSFIGYFPAYEPRFLVYLYTRNPKNVEFAAQSLTEPFMETARFLLNYYEVAPDR